MPDVKFQTAHSRRFGNVGHLYRLCVLTLHCTDMQIAHTLHSKFGSRKPTDPGTILSRGAWCDCPLNSVIPNPIEKNKVDSVIFLRQTELENAQNGHGTNRSSFFKMAAISRAFSSLIKKVMIKLRFGWLRLFLCL